MALVFYGAVTVGGTIISASLLSLWAEEIGQEARVHFDQAFPEYADETGQDPHWDTFRHIYTAAVVSRTLEQCGMSEQGAEDLTELMGGTRELSWFTNTTFFLTGSGSDIVDQMKKDLYNNRFGPPLGHRYGDDGDLADTIAQLMRQAEIDIQNGVVPNGPVIYADEYRLQNEGVLELGYQAFIEKLQEINSGEQDFNSHRLLQRLIDDYGWAIDNPSSILGEMLSLPSWHSNAVRLLNVDLSRKWDPLVVDLDGDGVSVDISSNLKVYFDLDADGMAEAINWISADDGILARDLNGNGKIDNGSELFGDAVVNGFDALAGLDTNVDGKISMEDADFSSLLIWKDINQNGVSESGELLSLNEVGITSIDIANYKVSQYWGNGVSHVSTALTSSEENIQIANVVFRTNQQNTHYMQDYDLDMRALFLPTLRGYGELPDLHVALSLDNGGESDSLMSQAIGLLSRNVEETFENWSDVREEFVEFMYTWAGVENVAPESRGIYVDARELAFLEGYLGTTFISGNSGILDEPGMRQGADINQLFDQITDRLMGNFFGQTAIMGLFEDAGSYNLEGDRIVLSSLHLSDDNLDDLSQYAFSLTDTDSRVEFWLGVADFISAVKLTSSQNLNALDEELLDNAIHTSDPSLGWYTEDHDTLAGLTSIEYRYANPLGETITGTSLDDAALLGTVFDDIIFGMDGADTIRGVAGNDFIYGHNIDGSGDDGADDILYGGVGNDSLFGGDGNDKLYGEEGNDSLFGGNGNDILVGGAGTTYNQNLLEGGLGDDRYETTFFSSGTVAGEDYISDDGGNDTVFVRLGDSLSDLQLMRIGNSTIKIHIDGITSIGSLFQNTYLIDQLADPSEDKGIEYIEFFRSGMTYDFKDYLANYTEKIQTNGSDANDEIHGIRVGSPDDVIYALGGNDVIYGDEGVDYIYGGDGDDEIHGGIEDDKLRGQSGNDIIYGDQGDDWLQGGIGDDIIYGGDGNDTLYGNEGTDQLYGEGGDDIIYMQDNDISYGGDGNDEIYGSIANDILIGGTGDDILDGQGGIDTASYRDALSGVVINLSLGYADNIDMGYDTFISIENLEGSIFDDTLIGTNAANVLDGNSGNDTLDGGANNDTLNGGDGSDILIGGSDRDFLYGDDGDDQLDGGTGNDSIYGGDGEDTVLFSSNSSNFIIYRDNENYLTILNTGDTTSYGYGTDKIYNDVETITFNDMILDLKDGSFDDIGSVWGYTTINGTLGNDTIYGFIGRDIIYAGEGSDIVYGQGQDDQIYGGSGNDTVYGDAGDDVVYGDSGSDSLRGGDGNDSLTGGDGNDQIWGDAGDDTLEGGLGTDTIQGGDGVDTVVYDTDSTNFIIYRNNTSFITVQDTGDTSTSTGYGSDKLYNDVELVQFNDVTFDLRTMTFVLNGESWGTPASIYGTSANDSLLDTRGNDIIYGQEGADTITASYGDDTLYGGSGNDTLYGGVGNDTLIGGLGTDYIYGGDGADTVVYDTDSTNFIVYRDNENYFTIRDTGDTSTVTGYGSDRLYNDVEYIQFNDVTLDLSTMTFALNQVGWGTSAAIFGTSANNTIVGYQANDLIYGYAGTDIISGGAGSDTLYGGDGDDYLYGQNQYNANDDGASDTLHGEAGNDIIYGHGGDDILIGGIGNDTLNGGAGYDTASYQDAVSAVTVSLAITSSQNTVSAGTDTLTQIENLIGSTYNDTLTGDANANTIEGGGGNDTLDGAAGNDTVSYANISSGVTVDIGNSSAQNTGGAGVDTLINFENIIGSSYNDTLTGDDLNNSISGGSGDDVLSGEDGDDVLDGGEGIDTVSYATSLYGVTVNLGTTGAQDTSGAGVDTLIGIENLVGSDADDYLYGDALDNILIGNGENDELGGGAGNDRLEGGAGSDTYIYNAGDGIDTILDEGEDYDLLYVGNHSINDVDSITSDAEGTMTITFGNSAGSIHVLNQSSAGYGVEWIAFADGYSLDLKSAGSWLWGSDGSDVIYGSPSSDTIIGRAGNDDLSGDMGNDTLYGGDGNDTLNGGGDADYLFGEEGDDILMGDTGDDLLNGGDGSDHIFGEAGNDMLFGDAGVDILNGGDGQDYVSGGADDDMLYGETGDDYLFGDDGADQLFGGFSNDTLYGGIGNDILHGEYDNDTLYGENGDDTLYGDSGADNLYGGDGNDTLLGGYGWDNLYGGNGLDAFVFKETDAIDHVKDFNISQGDYIELQSILIDYDPVTSAIADFVASRHVGGNTIISIDRDGAGVQYASVDAISLDGVTGVNIQSMLDNEQLKITV